MSFELCACAFQFVSSLPKIVLRPQFERSHKGKYLDFSDWLQFGIHVCYTKMIFSNPDWSSSDRVSVPNPLPMCALTAVGLPSFRASACRWHGSLDLRHAPAEFPLGRTKATLFLCPLSSPLFLSPPAPIPSWNLSDGMGSINFPGNFCRPEDRNFPPSAQ